MCNRLPVGAHTSNPSRGGSGKEGWHRVSGHDDTEWDSISPLRVHLHQALSPQQREFKKKNQMFIWVTCDSSKELTTSYKGTAGSSTTGKPMSVCNNTRDPS